MSVKIIILRKVPRDKSLELRPLLLKMRAYANEQEGYISGETLINYDNAEEHLVISTWNSIESWNAWVNNPARIELQSKVDDLLGTETVYQVYYNG